MEHPIYRITAFEKIGPYMLKITFDDQTVQIINFRPVLKGALFGSLKDERLFDQVIIDPEVHTLVWPNGADFDPATLHDWPRYSKQMQKLAQKWERNSVIAAPE